MQTQYTQSQQFSNQTCAFQITGKRAAEISTGNWISGRYVDILESTFSLAKWESLRKGPVRTRSPLASLVWTESYSLYGILETLVFFVSFLKSNELCGFLSIETRLLARWPQNIPPISGDKRDFSICLCVQTGYGAQRSYLSSGYWGWTPPRKASEGSSGWDIRIILLTCSFECRHR